MASEYVFGVRCEKPARAQARQFDEICVEEGGWGYTETNVKSGSAPNVNNGRYQGWFVGPNRGEPFNSDLRRRVLARIS